MILGRDEAEVTEVLLLRIDWVSVSCFSRSRPLYVGGEATSDEELSTRAAIVQRIAVAERKCCYTPNSKKAQILNEGPADVVHHVVLTAEFVNRVKSNSDDRNAA